MIEALAANEGRPQSSRYTLLEKLGEGGQGEVWRARDEATGTEVALKVLSRALAKNEAAWAGLEREHAIGSRLEHPNILRVRPPFRDGDFVALPMELAPGGDLRRLRGQTYLEIVPVLIDIAQALEHAHERGVIHRDLKPGNVLFDARGRVQLADFGSAGSAQDGAAARGSLSPFTASPEQLRGDPPAIADDIYGLGALAYELLSGYPPYYPRFEIKRVLEEPVPELKPAHQIPPHLLALVMRMLAKRPQLRPRTMREVIDELDASLNDTLTFDFDSLADTEDPAEAAAAALRARLEAHTSREPFIGSEPPRPPGVERRVPVAAEPVSDINAALSAAEAHAVRSGAAFESFSAPHLGANEPFTPRGETTNRASVTPPVSPSEPVAPRVPPPAPRRPAATQWDDLKIEPATKLQRYEPIPTRRWPLVVAIVLALVAVGVFYVIPEYGPPELAEMVPSPAPLPAPAPARPTSEQRTNEQPRSEQPTAAATVASTPVEAPAAAPALPPTTAPGATSMVSKPSSATMKSAEVAAAGEPKGDDPKKIREALTTARTTFEQRLAALEARGAGLWGGKDFALAKSRAAEAVGADDAGNPRMAAERLNEALTRLDAVEARRTQALATQLAAGDKALAAGQPEVAKQAFEYARRIDPTSTRARDGLNRMRSLGGVLPLLADGRNAETEKDFARAVQDYSQALSLDPSNADAKAGLARANAAFGDDHYAKAVGTGFAALGAGRLDDARAAFENARTIRPNGAEAATGLSRVSAALRARGFATSRQRGAALEAEERWEEAFDEYDAALRVDPSLSFAQIGRERAQRRAELNTRLQALIDRPERLAAPAVRDEAEVLIDRALSQEPSGPVLRSQVARLQILLPDFDKPVQVSLVSDNATQVAIQRVGSFGTFSRREIALKPGKYTVVGTRDGFRDVRRDITVAPGQDAQSISVSCNEPI
jgi:serine/threonine protein kinase/tetratricopeptide (TPR) repeat protein